MSSSEGVMFSRNAATFNAIHPAHLRFLAACFTMWTNIQRQRFKVLLMQKHLNNILLLYMKRRQSRLRFVYDLNNIKMKRLLEHLRSPYQFYKLFRVKLPAFLKIKDILYSNSSESTGWIPEIELLLFLFWLSAGSSYKKVSKLLGIPLYHVENLVLNVFGKFLKKVTCVINFSTSKTEDLSKGFMELASSHIFGLVVGCLDVYHIPIDSPLQVDDIQYMNSSSFFSIQVQAVCDHQGAFMDIAVGFPGSLMKSQIIQCTPLYLESIIPPTGYVLLSGYGYPCLQQPICLIPPFDETDHPLQMRFNCCYERVHSVMNKTVGQIFDRWRRIFSKPITLPLPVITKIIIACSMIHNICLEVNDIWPKEASVNFSVNQEDSTVLYSQTSGESTRKRMTELLLSDDDIQNLEIDYTVYEV